MKKTGKFLAGLVAVTLAVSSFPSVISAYDVSINTGAKPKCSESSYAAAEEIIDDYILNTFLADWFGDCSANHPDFIYSDGREHKVYAYDEYCTKNHLERDPQIFYITFDHRNEICVKCNEETDLLEFEKALEEFTAKQNIEGIQIDIRSRGFLVLGYDGVDEALAEKLGEYLEAKGMLKSISFTPSYADAMDFVIPYRYPYEYADLINSLITDMGLNKSDIYVDVSSGECKIEYASDRVTQKQRLELAAEIYRKTGFGQFDRLDDYKRAEDTSSVFINSNFADSERYITESGLCVVNQGYSGYHKDAVKITDDRITEFYSKLMRTFDPKLYGSDDFSEFTEFYAYDSVYFDNSKYNGEWMNRELLDEQIIAMGYFPSYMDVYVTENDTQKLAAVLDEKLGLSEKNIKITPSSYCVDIRGAYSEMTEETAESILAEIRSMGYKVDSANFNTCALSDGKICFYENIASEYPVSRQAEIMEIVNSSGVNAKAYPCQHYTDNASGYFDLVFDDVYNTTQMDIIRLRTEIYEKTGECGLINSGEFQHDFNGCLQFGLTDAVTSPGKTTYVDITLGQNTGFASLISNINYDHDVFELVSVSLEKKLGDDVDFLVSDNRSVFLITNNKTENIELCNEDVIRLAFKVKENAPDGKYEVSLSVPEGQQTGACCINASNVQWMKTEFTPGYITVDNNAVPKTMTKLMSLNRAYAIIKDDEAVLKSVKTGDTNNDGTLNIMDVMRMRKYLLGTSAEINNADTNEDGNVNISDMIILIQNILDMNNN